MAYNFTNGSTGAGKYISTPDASVLDITGALTLSCFFKADGTVSTSTRGLIAKWDTSSTQRSYALNYTATSPSSNSKINGVISSNGSFQAGNNVDGVTGLGISWRHAACVFIPSTSVTVFVDGAQDAQKTSGIPASIYSGTANLWIGMVAVAGDQNGFAGDIAEVAAYNTDLNSAEIASLSKGFKPARIRPQSLVFYAPLVRTLIELQESLALTNNNTVTVANHPRVI